MKPVIPLYRIRAVFQKLRHVHTALSVLILVLIPSLILIILRILIHLARLHSHWHPVQCGAADLKISLDSQIAARINRRAIDNLTVVLISLIGIGFFIYGPVMLIGVQALDLAPKNASGTAAGLTGFFGYFFGTFLLANTVIGYVAQHAGWSWTFLLLIVACLLAIFFMGLTLKEEKSGR